jgi:hypothetical protein
LEEKASDGPKSERKEERGWFKERRGGNKIIKEERVDFKGKSFAFTLERVKGERCN